MAIVETSAAPDPVRFAEFEVDRVACELRRRGERVSLSPQAVRALLVLLDAGERLVTRDEFYRALWPDAQVDVDRGLNTLVRQIRIALEDDATAPRFIRTYPGRGYRLRVLPTTGAEPRAPRWPRLVAVGMAAAALTLIVADRPPNGAPPLEPEPPAAAREPFLMGKYLLRQPVLARRADALPYLETAAQRAPNYAPAHAYLADALYWSGRRRAARVAARRALELDSTQAEARSLEGTLALVLDWDWSAALRSLEAAARAAPDRPDLLGAYAFGLITAGRSPEAIQVLGRARAGDPVSALTVGDLGYMYLYARRLPEAAEACSRALDLAPDARYALECAFDARRLGGDWSAARDLAARLVAAEGGDAAAVFAAEASDELAVRRVLTWRAERAAQRWRAGETSAFGAAVAFAGAGQVDEAIRALDQAFAEHSIGAVTVPVDPRFDPLREDPGFLRLVAPLLARRAARSTS